MLRSIRTALLSAAALTAVSGVARADIITALDSSVAIAGGYAYTYNVQLSGGQLDAVTNGTPVQFGTVYDFGPTFGSITTTGLLNQFTFTLNNVSTPTASQTSPIDNPSLLNIRFTYVGSGNILVAGEDTTKTSGTVINPGSDNLGTFTINSIYGQTATTRTSYDGQTYKGTNDTIQGNVGLVATPTQPTAVPEPATLAVLGAGLLGMGMVRRKRA